MKSSQVGSQEPMASIIDSAVDDNRSFNSTRNFSMTSLYKCQHLSQTLSLILDLSQGSTAQLRKTDVRESVITKSWKAGGCFTQRHAVKWEGRP